MDFAIHKHFIGSEHHLLITNNTIEQTDVIPTDTLTVGTTEFDDVCRLYLINQPTFPSANYLKAQQTVQRNGSGIRPPWRFCFPDKAYRRLVVDVAKDVATQLSEIDLTYYKTIYRRSGRVFDFLQPAKIDVTRWQTAKEHDTSGIVRSFAPLNGFAVPTEYSRLNTVTGRLTVTNGSNVLNLSKENRSFLVSRFGVDGRVVSIDYRSLEPRVLGWWNPTNGRREEDIYQQIKEELFQTHSITRNEVKKVVLSEIYGAGFELLHKEVPTVENLTGVIAAIREWFGTPELKTKLIAQAESTNRKYLVNCYGRRLDISDVAPYVYINRVVQSAAVDVALHGFANIVEYLDYLNRLDTIVPLYVLHDALICDVHKNAVHVLPTLCKIGSMDIPGFTNPFYLQAGTF